MYTRGYKQIFKIWSGKEWYVHTSMCTLWASIFLSEYLECPIKKSFLGIISILLYNWFKLWNYFEQVQNSKEPVFTFTCRTYIEMCATEWKRCCWKCLDLAIKMYEFRIDFKMNVFKKGFVILFNSADFPAFPSFFRLQRFLSLFLHVVDCAYACWLVLEILILFGSWIIKTIKLGFFINLPVIFVD